MYEPFEIIIYIIAILFGIYVSIVVVGGCISYYRSMHPSQKTLDAQKRIKFMKNEWRLRCDPIKESEREYLIDYDKFKKDLVEWNRYNTKRMYYAQKIIEAAEEKIAVYSLLNRYVDKEKKENVIREYNEYISYRVNNHIDFDFASENKELIWLMNRMDREGISFVYRPEIDYMPINGPDWSDCPNDSSLFVIKLENMGDVVMDKRRYFREDKLTDLMSIRYKI